jgi:hypothetical protein
MSLSRGHTKSCGCYNREKLFEACFKDLTGQKFHRLTVIKNVAQPKNTHSGTFWLCKCDCGMEKIINGSSLIDNHTTSCGCYAKEVTSELNKIEYGQAAKNSRFSQYKHSAKKRNLIFSLSKDEFLKLTQQNCFYCGKEPIQNCKNFSGNGNYYYNGIDRVDNEIGYILSNCVSCCGECNHAKFTTQKSDFFSWISRIYKHSVKGTEYDR